MDLQIAKSYRDEKSLQEALFNEFKNNGKWDYPCIEEGMSKNYSLGEYALLQEHQFLILSDLKDAVKKINNSLYNSYKKDLLNTEDEFYDLIIDHVISTYNIGIQQNEVPLNYFFHQYVFSKSLKIGINLIIEKKIEVKMKDGSIRYIEYNLVDLNYNKLSSNNFFRLVKEKKIRTSGLQTKDSEQYPDFAIYINGLPAFSIEVKTPTESWKKAYEDYVNKPTYHLFWGCIGIDGVHSFISCTYHQSREPRRWAKYGSRKSSDSYGAKDIIDELICCPRNLMYYASVGIQSTSDAFGGVKEYYLEALSVQQYYAVTEASKRFEMLTIEKNGLSRDTSILKEVIKHVQRSGKSKTIRAIISALYLFHNNLFQKVYIQVPDTTIRNQFLNRTFGDTYITNVGIVKEIKNQSQYIKSIESKEKGVYVMNMQKISEMANGKINNNKDILIILDEVHTHQLGENYLIRMDNFPNASYISFTATPRVVNKNGKLINLTNSIYADGKENYMDEFTSADAIDNNIIVPMIYQKANYVVNINDDALKGIEEHLYTLVKEKLNNPPNSIWQHYSDKIHDRVDNLLSILSPQEYEERREDEIKDFVNHNKSDLLKQLYREIKIEGMGKKIEWITSDIKDKRKNVYSNPITGEEYFKTKNFLVVDDIEMATEIICYIKKKYGSCNIDNIRFAVDYSFVSTSDESTVGVHKRYFPDLYERIDNNGNSISTGYSLKSLDELNDIPLGSDPIINEFNSSIDGSVDVLIIVGKYIMGYDNPNLVAVYCDTEFEEISRIYQLATRPATKRENKKCGYFIDLGISNKNSTAYKNAIYAYESVADKISPFVLDEDMLIKLNKELDESLENIGHLLDLKYPDDFKLSKIEEGLALLDNGLSKSRFFVNLTEINKIIKKLAIPMNYKNQKQIISFIGVAVSNYFDLLKAKKDSILKFTKEDIRSEINELFLSLGYPGGIKDVLDFQIRKANELEISDVDLERIRINKDIVSLKTKAENEYKYVNATIYEKIKDLIKYCDQSTSTDSKKDILNEIDNILLEDKNKKEQLDSLFSSPYERVTYENFNNLFKALCMDKIWDKKVYDEFYRILSLDVVKYFKTNNANIDSNELRNKIYSRYTPAWVESLKKEPSSFIENKDFAMFREKIISLRNKDGSENKDMVLFINNLIETYIITFEEYKGQSYV